MPGRKEAKPREATPTINDARQLQLFDERDLEQFDRYGNDKSAWCCFTG